MAQQSCEIERTVQNEVLAWNQGHACVLWWTSNLAGVFSLRQRTPDNAIKVQSG